MLYLLVKTFVTAICIVLISELARRYTIWAALLASLPITSILAFIWVYLEQKDAQKIIELSYSVFWLVIPSLAFFLILPLLLKNGVAFGWAMLAAVGITSVIYAGAMYFYKLIA